MIFLPSLVMSALRASESANPPKNMHAALIFNGVLIVAVVASVFLLRGRQRRRESDVAHLHVAPRASVPLRSLSSDKASHHHVDEAGQSPPISPSHRVEKDEGGDPRDQPSS